MQLRTQEEITAKWPENAEPIVCVRCITFKQEKFIAKCLEGFLIQETDFPFEVMIHEDASPDRTADIIREYEAKYPRILKPLYETENQWKKQDGTFTRIVTGMLKRKYVAMCEGDDYWTDPHKLQRQIDFLESHPEYSMIFHGPQLSMPTGTHPRMTRTHRSKTATTMLPNFTRTGSYRPHR